MKRVPMLSTDAFARRELLKAVGGCAALTNTSLLSTHKPAQRSGGGIAISTTVRMTGITRRRIARVTSSSTMVVCN